MAFAQNLCQAAAEGYNNAHGLGPIIINKRCSWSLHTKRILTTAHCSVKQMKNFVHTLSFGAPCISLNHWNNQGSLLLFCLGPLCWQSYSSLEVWASVLPCLATFLFIYTSMVIVIGLQSTEV